jgi:uncharacterized protein (DUF1778 family)
MARTKEPKAATGPRDKAYTVRYNRDEDALIAAAAEAKSLEVGSWIRMVSVEAARKEAKERSAE